MNSNVNGIEMRSHEDVKVHTYNNEYLMKAGYVERSPLFILITYRDWRTDTLDREIRLDR